MSLSTWQALLSFMGYFYNFRSYWKASGRCNLRHVFTLLYLLTIASLREISEVIESIKIMEVCVVGVGPPKKRACR